ncbi:hypothetical protein AA313_de0207448 [Arthrobotrys entomopaga]|nr:hypothetical protein AA313_de0207448 [Arthrobotrys entomopaga]
MTIGVDPRTGLLSDKDKTAFPDFFSKKEDTTDPDIQRTSEAWTTYRNSSSDDRKNTNYDIYAPTPIDPNEALLVRPPDDSHNPKLQGCCNMLERKTLLRFVVDVAEKARASRWPVLNAIAGICKGAAVYICDHPGCVEKKERLSHLLPECDWLPFRDWLVQLIACQQCLPPSERTTDPFFHLAAAANSFYWLFDVIKRTPDRGLPPSGIYRTKNGTVASIDLFTVCDYIHWGLLIQEYMGTEFIIIESWGKDMIPHQVAAKPIADALRQATEREHVLCPNRLWNLSYISERGEHDLPILVQLAGQHRQLHHEGHESCTASLCAYTSLDATRVKQLHRCNDPAVCQRERLEFDPEYLRESMTRGGGTAWSIDSPFKVPYSREEPYVAISHVWSDGTGIGLERPGLVNRCLFEYLAGIVRSLGCKAIWWDTISIPTDPAFRRQAINNMHSNYASAEYVLLHDRYLADVEWADDGSPCLAVVLSPWFTRGWTALEAAMAKRIKVIFKSPGSDEPIIKDLDDDVLAKDPGDCHPAHWVASVMIRRLRRAAQINEVGDLLAILKPRYTSWPRDRMIIAGLLAGVEVDYSLSAATITKKIIQKLKNISFTTLIHGEPTITESGGWSWCPNYIYDLTSTPASEFEGGSMSLMLSMHFYVDAHGSLGGTQFSRKVNREDVLERRIVPISSQPSMIFKVKNALVDWNNCILLGLPPGPFILLTVHPESQQDDARIKIFDGFISCNYVGSVHVIGEQGIFQSMEDGIGNLKTFLIGRQSDAYLRKFTLDSEAATFYTGTMCTPYNCHFLKDHIWMGDQFLTGELLVPTPSPPDGSERRGNTNVQKPGTIMNSLLVRQTDQSGVPGVIVTLNPRFKVSFRGVITNISTEWPSSSLRYSAAVLDTTPLWPPNSIAADARTKSFSVESFYNDEDFELHLFQQTSTDTITGTKLTSIQTEKPRGLVTFRVTFTQNDTPTGANGTVPRIFEGEVPTGSHITRGGK